MSSGKLLVCGFFLGVGIVNTVIWGSYLACVAKHIVAS